MNIIWITSRYQNKITELKGALIYGKPLISLQVMLKAIKADTKFYHLKFYLKYILKFPVFSVYYFLKSKL